MHMGIRHLPKGLVNALAPLTLMPLTSSSLPIAGAGLGEGAFLAACSPTRLSRTATTAPLLLATAAAICMLPAVATLCIPDPPPSLIAESPEPQWAGPHCKPALCGCAGLPAWVFGLLPPGYGRCSSAAYKANCQAANGWCPRWLGVGRPAPGERWPDDTTLHERKGT